MTVNRGDDNKPQNPQGPEKGTETSGVFGESFRRTGNAQASGNAQPQSTSSRSPHRQGISRLVGLRTGVGRRRPAADLEAMLEAFKEQCKSFTNASVIPEAQNFRLLMIDRNRLGKKVDILAAILPVVIDGNTHVAIHSMLIEDPGDNYEPVTLQVGGKQLRYTTVVGDVYREDLWATIVDIVSADAGMKITAYDAGHQTVYAEADVKDKDMIHAIAFFATEALTRTALSAILRRSDDIVALGDLGDNVQAGASIDFRTVDSTSAAGQPVRSDFFVRLRYNQPTVQGESQIQKAFDLDQSIPLGGAEGFIDLSYNPPPPAALGQQQQTQFYVARAVLTRLDTDQEIITPELQMLSLLGATLIGRNLNWARVWSPEFRGLHGDQMHDIGAIGYEIPGLDGNGGARVDTTSSQFDNGALARLVMMAVHPNPIISIDVEESGELTWLNRTLLEAAEGSADANQSIVNALDNLTNGHFSKRWNGGDLIIDDNNRIHLGYFMDNNNVKRDVRQLDYLAVLNRYGGEDVRMIENWQATYDNVDIDAEIRLAEREDLIRKILGPTVRITGYARRLTFAPDVLDRALEAAADAGLRIRPENTLIGFGQSTARGRPDLTQLAFGGNGGRAVFTHGTGGGGARGFQRPYTGRPGWR